MNDILTQAQINKMHKQDKLSEIHESIINGPKDQAFEQIQEYNARSLWLVKNLTSFLIDYRTYLVESGVRSAEVILDNIMKVVRLIDIRSGVL